MSIMAVPMHEKYCFRYRQIYLDIVLVFDLMILICLSQDSHT